MVLSRKEPRSYVFSCSSAPKSEDNLFQSIIFYHNFRILGYRTDPNFRLKQRWAGYVSDNLKIRALWGISSRSQILGLQQLGKPWIPLHRCRCPQDMGLVLFSLQISNLRYTPLRPIPMFLVYSVTGIICVWSNLHHFTSVYSVVNIPDPWMVFLLLAKTWPLLQTWPRSTQETMWSESKRSRYSLYGLSLRSRSITVYSLQIY